MKMRHLVTFLSSALFFTSVNALAYGPHNSTNLGDVANNILEVELAANSFIQFIFVTTGIGLIAASIYHFKLWNQNRLHRPFSRPVLFLIFGIILIGLVYIPIFFPK